MKTEKRDSKRAGIIHSRAKPAGNGKAAKPFLKWAGGKTQLIGEIQKKLPHDLSRKKSFVYVEPFIGGGAVFFWMLQHFPNIAKAVINDINHNLINAYVVVRDYPEELIKLLSSLQKEYRACSVHGQKEYYLKIRDAFNTGKIDRVKSAAYLIFLNRTCFNGLYRVNRNSSFNVPFGQYKNPNICDAGNITAASRSLKKTIIVNGSYEKTIDYMDSKSFVYLDPPYRPLNKTASFNAYASEAFNDESQRRLALFCRTLDARGHQWMLSNSDPKNNDANDGFFDTIYDGFSITRVDARRIINSDSKKRGKIKELLITNYKN